MKKLLSAVLSVMLLISFTSCAEKAEVLAEYSQEGVKPIYTAKLYSDPRDEKYAFLLREDGKMQSCIATGTLTSELKTVYTAPSDGYIYEMYANGGTVAFYEMHPVSNGTRYDLKVIDTETDKVYSPYSKLISRDDDMQPRFVAVYNDCVYYLTVSLLLESCRVMKFDPATEELSEFIVTPFTENSLTYNHSSTFINRRDDNLVVSRVDGAKQYIDVYSLSSGQKVSEKLLPSSVGIVYNCDYDARSGVYAVYYGQLESGNLTFDAVGIISHSSEELKRIFSAGANTYLDREALRIENNILLFNLSKDADSVLYDNYDGILYNMATDELTRFSGSMHTWYDDGNIYNLMLDKKLNSDKITLTKRQIISK